MAIIVNSIGTIYSSFDDPRNMARQSQIDGRKGFIELDERYIDGLEGLSAFSHVIALYHFHREAEIKLKVNPLFDLEQLHGIFSCRFPKRPNHIGLSVLSIERIERGLIYCSDVDVLNGTPLLDLKPYVKQFDMIPAAKSGWYDSVDWGAQNCALRPPREVCPSSLAA